MGYEMEKKIELVHFQITKNCNLRCWFCGQWGEKGFFSDACGTAMEFADWERVITQLLVYREKSGILPDIMLWGGEPLLCPFFEKLVILLRKHGFRLGLVTNGTLIDKYAHLLKEEFYHIYVSVDGDRESHDRIRGKGVFDRVSENLELVYGGNARITITTVISKDNLSRLSELPDILCGLSCDEILLQEMIALSEDEAQEYRRWMRESFGQEAVEIASWVNTAVDKERKEEQLARIMAGYYPKKVRYLSHGQAISHCRAPFSHIHIAWNGNVLYCTDFYDFSAGNVKKEPLLDIFENEYSDTFRKEIAKGHCATCNHCSWKNNVDFWL